MKTKYFLSISTNIFLLVLAHVLFQEKLQAQSIPKLQDPTNPFIINNAIDIDPGGGVIYFKENVLLQGQLFNQYYSSTGMGVFDSVPIIEVSHDSILADEDSPAPQLAHNKYQQYYKGVLVEGAIYVEHFQPENGNVLATGGFLVENLNMSVVPSIGESEALNAAKTHINAETYSWDSDGVYPIGKLIIIPMNTEGIVSYKLVWKFTINATYPYIMNEVYVNANTGSIEKNISLIHQNTWGNFNHMYYGHKSDLDTRTDYGIFRDDYHLFANDDSRNIYTTDDRKLKSLPSGDWRWELMTWREGTNTWGSSSNLATSTHYCAQKAWDYFKSSPLNRNGMTGWGKHLRIHADWDWAGNGYTSSPGAFYTNDDKTGAGLGNDYIALADAGGKKLNTYDILGHEFTHGIILHSNPLPNERVSGAIGESFSDIFGLMVERYAKFGTYNWTIGEDAGLIVRNMFLPGMTLHPTYFQDPNFWANPNNLANDNGGVHINCGVQNRWFYLLSMGGSQVVWTNNAPSNRIVSGIGIDKAARIAYYAMTNKALNYNPSNNTTFDAVRANTILAARKLYGICSNEYIQTCRAWYAVNVGPNCNPCPTIPFWFSRNFRFNQNNTLTGIEERKNELLQLKLFPNPANDKIRIVLEENNMDLSDNNYTLNIIGVDGKVVWSNTYSTIDNLELNIADIPSGIYFLNISTIHWTKNTKFVKQ